MNILSGGFILDTCVFVQSGGEYLKSYPCNLCSSPPLHFLVVSAQKQNILQNHNFKYICRGNVNLLSSLDTLVQFKITETCI